MTLIPGARKHELAQKMKLKVKELLGGKLNGSMFDKKK
jgi:hypothetical protein